MNIENYIAPEAIEYIRAAIREAEGNEVFFVGKTNDLQVVEQVAVIARGNEFAVPVVREVAARSDVVIHNHPSGELAPSENDMAIAHDLAKDEVASFIVNNQVDDIYVVIEPFRKAEQVAIDGQQMIATLAPGGIVSKKLKGYEHRPQQLAMINKVAEAFNHKKIAMIEAGTGVGKSLAYLIPAIYWATSNNERCVVSTNTINLQEQLIKKDIPFLKKALGLDFESVLVKGRGNYLCLRKVRAMETGQQELIEPAQRDELKAIISWSKVTQDGSRSDLNFVPSAAVWEEVCSESDSCLRSRCEFFQQCFVTKARRQANRAHILVVNHHLLFADLAVQAAGADVAVLPRYHHIVFDEAHNIEDVATDYFGAGITRAGIARIIRRLYGQVENKPTGLLVLFAKKLGVEYAKHRLADLKSAIDRIEMELIPRCDAMLQFNEEVMSTLGQLIQEHDKNWQSEAKLRIDPGVRKMDTWQSQLVPQFKNFLDLIKRFCSDLSSVIEKVELANLRLEKDILYTVIDLKTQNQRLRSVVDVIEAIILKDDQQHVRWAEAQRRRFGRDIVRLKMAPLEIAESMNELVYQNYQTIVMTSATLTIAGTPGKSEFSYLARQLGLHLVERSRVITAKIPGSFDYKRQVIIAIPLDLPNPDSDAFADAVSDAIFKALKISGGRAFVLFTSYGLMNNVHEKLAPGLAELGIASLKQGQQNRHELLEQFKQDKTSVLFGTDSFWQGVDVEGDALENVIITKLPFKVPSEPIIEARVEAIERRGGNAFLEYSLPQAVIKLKQGFGRLIRKKTDIGSVFIFDKRIIEKYYGKFFLQSLPDTRIVQGKFAAIQQEVTAFFQQFRK
ncbi:MAG: DEAD/DEAH box helicase [candidate division KSB1 bacterium]|nr:DEAD/DEAH box helicase [candidate division KSB1 bacterium]MDZ7318197.1 DEAD/DEAH box helicase [candidate division KSB1 bacterium]MDZ7341602.1 DEAD/DEAH box helicase [candidate division KSB1 bacterium]